MGEQIKLVMARIFELPVGQISDDATIERIPEWDSLKHLELMLELEVEFSVVIPAVTMLELLSYNAIEKHISGLVSITSDDGRD